ncbi:MAG: hypothetical protein V3S85_01790 [Nitrospirales bacterium]
MALAGRFTRGAFLAGTRLPARVFPLLFRAEGTGLAFLLALAAALTLGFTFILPALFKAAFLAGALAFALTVLFLGALPFRAFFLAPLAGALRFAFAFRTFLGRGRLTTFFALAFGLPVFPRETLDLDVDLFFSLALGFFLAVLAIFHPPLLVGPQYVLWVNGRRAAPI